MVDRLSFISTDADDPASDTFSITPHDSTNFTKLCRGIYVGGAGNITLITAKGTVQLFTAVPVGWILPVRATRVNSTGTTATALVGLV